MFNCYAHGWSHIQTPCPICSPVETWTSSGTTATIPTSKVEENRTDKISDDSWRSCYYALLARHNHEVRKAKNFRELELLEMLSRANNILNNCVRSDEYDSWFIDYQKLLGKKE